MVENIPDSTACELMLAEALAHVPGFRPGDPAVEVVALPGGSVNRSYRVSTPEGRFVGRVSSAADAWLASDRSVERELHGVAAAAGLAPRIVHADSRDRWLITEYSAGEIWSGTDFQDPSRLGGLAATLRRLHALRPPEGVRRVDLLAVLQDYVDHTGTGGEEGGRFVRYAAEAWRVSGAPERPVAIVHHDLIATNIIERAGGPLLIDWECAAVSDPLLDLACILSYYPSAWAHEALLLRDSGLEGVTRRHLAAAAWLFDLHTWLWYRERRLRLLPTDAEVQAEQKLLQRLPAGLERWQTVTS
jgi:aminoglycoside phosphotransferase (APT) family kinase protein